MTSIQNFDPKDGTFKGSSALTMIFFSKGFEILNFMDKLKKLYETWAEFSTLDIMHHALLS
jgi:hypothetical protein